MSGRVSLLLAFLLLPLTEGTAQAVRYQLGLRVRAFERAFEPRLQDLEARRRVCASLQRAVTAFFAARPGEVGREVDGARRLLDGAGKDGDGRRWADSLELRLGSRLVDVTQATLAFQLRRFYRVDVERPEAARLRLVLERPAGARSVPMELAVSELPLKGSLPLDLDAEGDHRLRVALMDGETLLSQHVQTVSVVRELGARMKEVRVLARAEPAGTLAASKRGLARLLVALAGGRTLETDVPAARILKELEQLTPGFWSVERPGDFRLWLAIGRRPVAVRLLVPKAAREGGPLPLVVALHGAGGTENLFFDAYGDGKIVRLCEERGWLLVAPRLGMTSGVDLRALVEAMRELLPVDVDRVFVVGHSMGAMQAMAATQKGADRLAAVAVLGGGGSIRASDALRRLPVFVAPGDRDFALRGARRLRDALQQAGLTKLVYREYEATEHLAIVQVALDDVFAFFDEAK